jgi:hypothetical protein
MVSWLVHYCCPYSWVPLSFDCHLSDHSPLALLHSSFGRSFISIFVARVPMTKVTSTAGTQFDPCDNTDQVEEHRSLVQIPIDGEHKSILDVSRFLGVNAPISEVKVLQKLWIWRKSPVLGVNSPFGEVKACPSLKWKITILGSHPNSIPNYPKF